MYKLQAKRVKATAGRVWSSNLSKIRKSLKNVYHKCKNQYSESTRYPPKTSYDCDQEDLSTDEETNLTAMLQDIKTIQCELLSQITNIVSEVPKIQKNVDFFQKHTEGMETRMNANENKQHTVTKEIFFLRKEIDDLKKKVIELENQNSCASVHYLEILEREKGKEIIKHFHQLIEPETSISTDAEIHSKEPKTMSSYLQPTGHPEENTSSTKVKNLKKINQPDASRHLKKANPHIHIYPDFRTWIKLTFVHGEKWGFFLSPTKLEEFIQWLLSRPTIPLEEPQCITQRYYPLAGSIAGLTTICLSVFNYICCLFGSSKEQVTRL
ncbi:PREDICTED: coiled-coil domain-containing protein 54 [Condylura cristata]|uniref:coiled-coil domain-containing protein 54 n=1 Tax=Condylura cristata TaxID=143302 RepID=UPI0003344673|nr:PREDICTED: coiled-coil domain-containing protein 54 [Condylura cristata]